jgi:hypothetical protein
MIKEIEIGNMEHPAENVLGLEKPENYSCQIWYYTPSHSNLIVLLNEKDRAKGTPPLYLVFDSVRFFEGPLGWNGANFCTSTLYDYAELNIALQIDEELPENFVQKMVDQMEDQKWPSRLFTLSVNDKIQVRILASYAALTDDLSPWPQIRSI